MFFSFFYVLPKIETGSVRTNVLAPIKMAVKGSNE
jgi:hypothetical protein